MVSNTEGTRLSVIQGMKDSTDCTGNCKSDAAKEASTSHDPLNIKRYDAELKQLLLAKLAHNHQQQVKRLEEGMQELNFTLALERLTFGAALDGVPVKHIEASHEQAFEALESAQNRVA
jgi:hypothetical protein